VKLDRSRAALAVIDVQEAFRPVVLDFEQIAANVAVLIQSARILALPVLVTEQYRRASGRPSPRSRTTSRASSQSRRSASVRSTPTASRPVSPSAIRSCCAASRRTSA
jgi:nicotinamidase-related amidase